MRSHARVQVLWRGKSGLELELALGIWYWFWGLIWEGGINMLVPFAQDFLMLRTQGPNVTEYATIILTTYNTSSCD